VKLKNKAKKDSIERKKNWKMDLKKKKKKGSTKQVTLEIS
jgi:hypothetical protein